MIRAGTFVLVTWEDIQTADDDWNDADDPCDTATMHTCGWVAKDYDRRYRKLVLGGSYSVDEDTIHDRAAYPTGCITRIQSLLTGADLWDKGKDDG